MTRAYARADRGERAVAHVPKNWGDSITLAAGIGLRGLIAPLFMHGSMTGDIFEALSAISFDDIAGWFRHCGYGHSGDLQRATPFQQA